MRKIQQCFNSELTKILHHVTNLEQINQRVQAFLPPTLQPHCYVSQFINGRLKLSVRDIAVATELRFFLPTLRDLLRQKAGLVQLTSITIDPIGDTAQHQTKQHVKKKNIALSESAIDTIVLASDSESYEPLKQALKKLVRNK